MVRRILILTHARAFTQSCFLLAAESAATESPRIASFVGNSAYSQAPLANAVNEANLVADNLKNQWFVVLQHNDLTQKATKIAVRKLSDALAHAGPDTVGLFHYS